MATGVLAQLKVVIGAEISKLKSGLDEAKVHSDRTSRGIEKSFHRLGGTFDRLLGPLSSTGREVAIAFDTMGEAAAGANRKLSGLNAALGLIGGVGVGAMVALTGATLKMFHTIDEQADLAKAVGLTTSQYVQFTNALKLYGVEQQQLTPGLGQFFKIVSGLMRSKAGETAIQQLGLDMKKLRLMDTHDQLMAVADAFSKFPDGPRKSAWAAQLFTATLGEKMIPLLDQGAAGVAKLEEKYKSLGDESEKVADTTKNLSIAFSQAFSNVESALLKASGALGIPTMLLAIAHPLATVKALVLDAGSVLTGFLGKWLGALQYFIGQYNNLLKSVHLPTISTEGLARAVDYMHRLSASFQSEAARAASPLFGSGETALRGGGSIIQAAPTGPSKATTYLDSLKQQVAAWGNSDVQNGLAKMRELGATEQQLVQGGALLRLISELKQGQKFTEEFAKAQEKLNTALGKIADAGAKKLRDDIAGAAESSRTLVNNLMEAGRSALGIKSGSFQDTFRQGALTGIGNPLAGLPGFTPSGLGAMRFNMEKLSQSAEKLGETFRSSFTRMIEGGQSFGQMLTNLRHELELFIIKALVFKQIATALKSAPGFLGVIGSFFGGLAAPGRASGGPVSANRLYKVGEHGPEYFAPTVSGTIIPFGQDGKERPAADLRSANVHQHAQRRQFPAEPGADPDGRAPADGGDGGEERVKQITNYEL